MMTAQIIGRYTSVHSNGSSWRSFEFDNGDSVDVGHSLDVFYVRVNRFKSVWMDCNETIRYWYTRWPRLGDAVRALLVDELPFLSEIGAT